MEHFKKEHKDYDIFRGGLADSIHGMIFKVELCIKELKVNSCHECKFHDECKKLESIKTTNKLYEKRYNHKVPRQEASIVSRINHINSKK